MLQRRLDLLIDRVGNAQRGVLQPQIISPYSLMEALMQSASALPGDVTFPFPLSKDSAYLALRVCNLQLYVSNGVLAYVIHVPMVNRVQFLIPIPKPVDQTKFLFVDTRNSFLWIDKARQYYFMTDKYWLDTCKEVNIRVYVCKQDQPLLSSQVHENCMVKLLQSRESISPSCEKRIAELSDSVWTQLENNERIYFIPTSEGIAILCNDRNPAEVALTWIGKLRMNTNCRG
ncbi:hypothetical protein B7P43_G14522 [Cryptotermes secundus]|uniref:Uncharacterized protein n=1 Tax=Cryptotermes secundus TaxID=105785 RepID=A0A2J7QYE4_9NEOP|nr:hypothetical protein B7P43_G14522 [Cryptotermes secundus]